MSSREEFEAWASSPAFGLSPGHFKKDEEGEYINYPAHCYWLVWQASRQALEIVLPEPFPLGDGYGLGLDPEDTRAAIEAAGVRVKT